MNAVPVAGGGPRVIVNTVGPTTKETAMPTLRPAWIRPRRPFRATAMTPGAMPSTFRRSCAASSSRQGLVPAAIPMRPARTAGGAPSPSPVHGRSMP